AGRLVHSLNPTASSLARVRRIAQIDRHEYVVREPVEQRGDIGPAAAGVPDAMNAAALNRHEADAPRPRWIRNVMDSESCGPIARGARRLCRADYFSELSLE